MLNQLDSYDLILASGSPRRKQLLAEMSLKFQVRVLDVDERLPYEMKPAEAAVFLSELKADAFDPSEMKTNTLVITADTIVCIDNEILGKPADKEEAFAMLQQLSGREHEVVTAVCLRSLAHKKSFSVSTQVYFKDLSEDEITYYIDHFKPFDKAGAYGIQEWIGHAAIEKIEGSYFNVMGLPTHRLYEELRLFIS